MLCTRRLGDVLLGTPLLRSLRRAWPQAAIDVLTYAASAAALEGNPDIRRVATVSTRAGLGESLRAIGGLRGYDLAVPMLYNDRPHLLAICASATRVGVVPGSGQPGARWKRWSCERWVVLDATRTHTVTQYLGLADALGIPKVAELVPPEPARPDAWRERAQLPADAAYAVVHPSPLYRYKSWTVAGWATLCRWLAGRGLRVVLTGGPAAAERELAAEVARSAALPASTPVDLAGQLRFAELTPLLRSARLYVGPDTSVTHLAAASGAPTVALFGPTDPVAWGPWPRGTQADAPTPWRRAAPLQQRGNVWIVQGLTPCAPCLQEGCERHVDSRSDCLAQLPAARVIAAADAALA